MRNALAAALILLSAPGIVAQEKPAAATSTPYKVPRTRDGHPDLQGYWTNLTYTPFERPKELANKPLYSEHEAIDAFNKAVADSQNQVVHYVNTDFAATPVQTGAKPNRRTSLVIDPADGRVPPLTPDAQKREAARLAADRPVPLARTWRDDRGTVWCVFHDRAVPSIVAPYGSNYHIVQSRDWIVLTYEWNSEHRIIPLDGRPHGPSSVRTYAGDASRPLGGRHAGGRDDQFQPEAEFLWIREGTFKLVDRFTRISDDTIIHTYTVEDPATWTRPWTVELPMHRINGPMLEYACKRG